MRPYFEKMPAFGKALKENRIARTQESRARLEAVEAEIAAAKKAAEEVGIPTAKINKRGGLTVWQRLEYLVDPAPGGRCTPCTTRRTTRKARPTWSTASARSPGAGR